MPRQRASFHGESRPARPGPGRWQIEAVHPIPESVEESSLIRPLIQVNPWIVLGVLLLGEFMILLDTTILEVAIPSLLTDLHASLDSVLWVLNAYILTFAVLLITAGRLGDILGPKKLYMAGLVIFGSASAACGLAHDPGQLITFRIFQAIGGAVLTPQPATIITYLFPPEKRSSAFGVMGAVMGLAAVAGPTLGGFLTTAYSWRAIFYPNVPIAAATLILAFLIMPEVSIDRRRHLDVVGVLLSTSGMVLCMFGLIEGQRYQWERILDAGSFSLGPLRLSPISIPTVLLAGVLLLVVFVVWETRQDEPLLPLSLFRDRNFSIGNVVIATTSFGMVGLMFTLLLFLQSVLGLTALQAGIAIIPNAVLVIFTAPLIGKFGARLNGKYILCAGMLIYSAGLGVLILLASLHATGLTFTPALILTGIGMGCTVAPVVTLSMTHVAPTAAGAASGFLNTSRQMGGAIGSAVVGAVLQSGLATELQSQAAHYSSRLPLQYRAPFTGMYANSSKGGLDIGRGQTGAQLPTNLPSSVTGQFQSLSKLVFDHAYLNAVRPSWAVIVGAAVCTAVASLFMRIPRFVAVPVETGLPAEEPAMPRFSMPIQGTETVIVPYMVSRQFARPPTRPLRPPFLARMGGGPYAEYPVKNPLTIGRAPGNDLVVEDPRVSRRHAELFLLDGETVLRDLNSANGTLVNGRRVEGAQRLRPGDAVAVGNTSYVFHDDLAVARPRLERVDGTRREYPLRTTLTLGRAPDNDIVVEDPLVSRRHAEVGLRDHQVMVRDLESLNGTKVNGNLVSLDQPLREGDMILLGSASFVYHNDAEAAAAGA